MKIFIFKEICKLTCRYHSERGLVIIANNKEHAKEILNTIDEVHMDDNEWLNVEVFDLKNEESPKYWIMPNSGCC